MRAKKHFGQHFLHDPFIIKKIVDVIGPAEGTDIIEIGPGPGALTRPLLESGATVHAVEVDDDMVTHLQRQFSDESGFFVHHEDVLQTDFTKLTHQRPLQICGNLPYNISSPLLFHLAAFQADIGKMVFMMQKEVIDRIVASPGNKDYGRLTVALGQRFSSVKCFNVKPGAFNPPPKVDSSIVLMHPRKPGELTPVKDIKQFDALVKLAFSQRRKMLRKVLKGTVSEPLFEQTGIDSSLRAEDLSTEQFIALSNALTHGNSS